MEKLYSSELKTDIYSNGKNIEDALHSLNIPCVFLEAVSTIYSKSYYFKLTNALAVNKLDKIIKPLEVLLSAQEGEITIALTPSHETAHFSLTIETTAQKPIPLSNYKDMLKSLTHTMMYGIEISTGEVIYSNLLDTPHLLIAGASGSGKSVLLHNIIDSLSKYKQTNLSFVLIDTKQVEFAQYEKSDDMLACPICYDTKTAICTLRAICDKMEERFAKMRQKGLKVYDGTKWVIVIDEFADLMLSRKSQIEPLIVKIAQMGRACGIHLVIATQRPSVDVCTGLIKANIPDRIALKCASVRDSMVILDKKGAETLKGKGEALVRINNEIKKIKCFYKGE